MNDIKSEEVINNLLETIKNLHFKIALLEAKLKEQNKEESKNE